MLAHGRAAHTRQAPGQLCRAGIPQRMRLLQSPGSACCCTVAPVVVPRNSTLHSLTCRRHERYDGTADTLMLECARPADAAPLRCRG